MLRILESQFISDFTDSFFRSQYPFFGYIDYFSLNVFLSGLSGFLFNLDRRNSWMTGLPCLRNI